MSPARVNTRRGRKGAKQARGGQGTDAILARLEAMGDPASIAGRARFGIPEMDAYGVSLPQIRRLAKEIGRDHALARTLWASGKHEARLLATLVAEPEAFTRREAERWLKDVVSWDVCDGLCLNLVDRTEWAWDAVARWADREDEWTRRAAFATLAGLAWHRKDAPDSGFARYFPLCENAATDERNYVKKAVSWSLRQMGKRSPALKKKALASATRLSKRSERSARWIGSDVRRDLERARGRA